MAFAALTLAAIDPDTAAALHIFLPFPVGFSACWLAYRRIREIGLQSDGTAAFHAGYLLGVAHGE